MPLKNEDGSKKKKDQRVVVGFTKPKKFLFFKTKAKPIYEKSGSTGGAQTAMASELQSELEKELKVRITKVGGAPPSGKKYNSFQRFIAGFAARHKDLELSLKTQGIKESTYDFVKKMFFYALII